MSRTNDLINQIRTDIGDGSRKSSNKDEVEVMRTMMNDTEYIVNIYNDNNTDTYNPGEDIRKMMANVISETTCISKKEAKELLKNYEFSKSDARTMVRFGKEYVNTYLQTGRKYNLGGRNMSNVSLLWKNIQERSVEVPVKGTDERRRITIPSYEGIKAINEFPAWIKKI